MKREQGHTLLAKLGKKRLRPGGKKGTNYLLKQTNLNDKKILEVACNMGTTSLELAKKYHVDITAIDLDTEALVKAQSKLKQTKIKNKLNFVEMDALALTFDKDTFDVVLNEAMLTMLPLKKREVAVNNYYNVLKNDGLLLTHDVCLFTEDKVLQKEIIAELSRAINVHVTPLTPEHWQLLFLDAGFKKVEYISGPMSLLNPVGMIRDEGILNTLKIIKNAHKKHNKPQFKQMYQVFKKYKQYLGFIAVVSEK